MQKGDFVRIAYVARLESGEIFDLTDEELAKKENIYNPNIKYKPVPIIVGASFVIPGLDKAVSEMNVGDKKNIEIEPKDAFGERDSKLVRTVSKSVFRDRLPQPGMIVDFSGQKGRIQSVNGGRVRIDFNNPLSGKKLKYELEITEQITDQEEKIKSIFEFIGAEAKEVKIEAKEVTISIPQLPAEIKQRVSSLIIEHVKDIEKANFIETYQAKEHKE